MIFKSDPDVWRQEFLLEGFCVFYSGGVDEPPKRRPELHSKTMAPWGSSFTYILSILIGAGGKYIPYMKGYG